jgi:hypothetical protein
MDGGEAAQQRGTNQSARQQNASASRSESQESRQQYGSQAQQNRQDYGNAAREDRQDAWDDAADDFHGGVYVGPGGGVHVYDGSGLAAATAVAVGTAVSVSAIQQMTTPTASGPPACTMESVTVAGANYYHCEPNWYQKAYVNGEMSYVSVAPPPGF